MNPQLLVAPPWSDYELIDTGEQRRLERFGDYILNRPDPQAIWKRSLSDSHWGNIHAIYTGPPERGEWQIEKPTPKKWTLQFSGVKFRCQLFPFKHTGIFPEQSAHWEWIINILKKTPRPLKILNLFGYTGIASLIAARHNCQVTHIDSSYPTIAALRENIQLNPGLEDKIRSIQEDSIKFVKREINRISHYDAIILDPPIFGHGPKGETWKFNEHFPTLFSLIPQLLSSHPSFLIVTAYALTSSSLMLKNMFTDLGLKPEDLEFGELALREKSNRLLSTCIFARWSPR